MSRISFKSFQSVLSPYKMFILLMLALLLNACGTDEDLIEDQHNNTAGIGTFALDQNYMLVTSDGINVSPNHSVSLSFSYDPEGQDLFISLNAGCNAMSGVMETVDSVLHVNELSSTLMACEQTLMEQDRIFADFISNQPQMVWTSSTIILSNESTTLRFLLEYVIQEDVSITDTFWTVTGFIDGEVASSLIGASRQTIQFEPDNQVKINLGCNSCFGSYEVDGNQISFESLACTDAVCQNEEDQAAEDSLSSLLLSDTTYEIDGSKLTLMNADQQRAVTLGRSYQYYF